MDKSGFMHPSAADHRPFDTSTYIVGNQTPQRSICCRGVSPNFPATIRSAVSSETLHTLMTSVILRGAALLGGGVEARMGRLSVSCPTNLC